VLKIPAEYDKDTSSAKLTDFFAKLLLASQLVMCVGICQRAVVDESGSSRTEMGTHNRSAKGRSAWDALYNTTP
jgi:hypothetical protein